MGAKHAVRAASGSTVKTDAGREDHGPGLNRVALPPLSPGVSASPAQARGGGGDRPGRERAAPRAMLPPSARPAGDAPRAVGHHPPWFLRPLLPSRPVVALTEARG